MYYIIPVWGVVIMKITGKKAVVPALVLAGGLMYQTLADKVKDTYNQIMPETAQHEVAHKDYAGEFLENILEQNKLYAGGLSEQEKKGQREANLPKELQGDIFDYFDGEIYSKDEFHKVEDRWNFNEALSKKTGDLKYVFDDTTELYDMLGKHIEKLQDKVAGVVYDLNNKKEFAVLIDYGNKRYACFKEFEQPGMRNTLNKYDDHIVH